MLSAKSEHHFAGIAAFKKSRPEKPITDLRWSSYTILMLQGLFPMLEGIAQSLVLGDWIAWSIVALLWLFSLALVWLNRKGGHPSQGTVFALLIASSLTSIAGTIVASSLYVPHLRWTQRPPGELLATSGDSWRKLRGPWALVHTREGPDIAIPTIDSEGRWALFGLFSERALPDFGPAEEAAPAQGKARLCAAESTSCRAWPASWPDPLQEQGSLEFVFSAKGALYAAAFDKESKKYLIGAVRNGGGDTPDIEDAEALANTNALELVGRIGTPPPRGALSSLFIARRVLNGHFEQVRIVASGQADNTFVFSLERAGANLRIGMQFMRYIARPLMLLSALALPFTLLILLFCPSLLARHLAKRAARRVEKAPILLELLAKTPGSSGPLTPARVVQTAALGEKTLKAGDIVAVMIEAEREHEGIASFAWYEFEGAPSVQYTTGEIISHSTGAQGAKDQAGVLVAADGPLFRRAALSWVRRPIYVMALLSLGFSAFVPGAAALLGLWASR